MATSDTKPIRLTGAAEMLLVTLYLRAVESQRPDALIHDERAVAMVAQITAQTGYDFAAIERMPLTGANKFVIIVRSREFDRRAQAFLAQHPDAVVVHLACGLDARFERVDNGRVEWYDLDLPDVINLRRQLLGGERERYHLLGCSALEDAWLDTVGVHRPRSFLFLAEGLFMYLRRAQVKSLVLKLRDRFSGSELAFDIFSPLHTLVSNLQLSRSKVGATHHPRFDAALWNGHEVEHWGAGIRLLGEWGFFDDPTPRLDYLRWMRPVENVVRTMRIYHFRLGEPVERK